MDDTGQPMLDSICFSLKYRDNAVESCFVLRIAAENGQRRPLRCGKSTLLNIIGLQNNPTSGSYLLDGKDVSTQKESEHRILWYENRPTASKNMLSGDYVYISSSINRMISSCWSGWYQWISASRLNQVSCLRMYSRLCDCIWRMASSLSISPSK